MEREVRCWGELLSITYVDRKKKPCSTEIENEGFWEAAILQLIPSLHCLFNIISLEGNQSLLTPQTELVSSCCGNQICCWLPCPHLSGSDGLWTSNGPWRFCTLVSVWLENRDRIPVGVQVQVERRNMGLFMQFQLIISFTRHNK